MTAGLLTVVAMVAAVVAAIVLVVATLGATGNTAVGVIGMAVASGVGRIGLTVVLVIYGLCAGGDGADGIACGRGCRESGCRAQRRHQGTSHQQGCKFLVHHNKIPHFVVVFWLL